MSIIQYRNECCLYSPIPSTQEAEENLYILFTHVDYVNTFCVICQYFRICDVRLWTQQYTCQDNNSVERFNASILDQLIRSHLRQNMHDTFLQNYNVMKVAMTFKGTQRRETVPGTH